MHAINSTFDGSTSADFRYSEGRASSDYNPLGVLSTSYLYDSTAEMNMTCLEVIFLTDKTSRVYSSFASEVRNS
jgi:hypothetical protein